MSNRFYQNVGNVYVPHNKPIIIQGSFIVNSSDSQGYGQTSLQAPGVKNVYMHTSATPPSGSSNPLSGYCEIELADNYQQFLMSQFSFCSPVTGSNINISGSSVLTVGKPYVITAVGTSTAANFQAVGLQSGVTPAVGVSFIASATGSSAGTGTVKAVGISGISHVECVTDFNSGLTPGASIQGQAYQLGPINLSSQGGKLQFQFLAPTDASTTTLIPTAPANGTVVKFTLMFQDSSTMVANRNP